jgi:hypothetical protein
MASFITPSRVDLQVVRDAYGRAIPFMAWHPPTRNAIQERYRNLMGWSVAQVNQFVNNLPQHWFPTPNPPNQNPIPPPAHPHPHANIQQHHINNLVQDFDIIRQKVINDELFISTSTTLNGQPTYIKIPQVTANPAAAERAYQEALLQILAEHCVYESLFPFLVYESLIKDRDEVGAEYVLDRGLFFYHATVAHVDRNNGVIEENNIINASLGRCNINPNMQYLDIDNPPPDRDQLWGAGQNTTQPPVGVDRLLPAYVFSNLHREKGQQLQEYVNRIGQINFDRFYGTVARNQCGWPDDGEHYFNLHQHLNVILPGNLHQTSSYIVNGSHYNRHVGNDHWQFVRHPNPPNPNAVQLQHRANEYFNMAENHIRNNVSDPTRAENTGDKSYATTTLLSVFYFHLITDIHWELHFPHPTEEFSKSMLLQMLLHSDLRAAHATKATILHHNLISWKFPVSPVAQFHIQLGAPSRPFLGSVFTVTDECYRPINQDRLRYFRFVQ